MPKVFIIPPVALGIGAWTKTDFVGQNLLPGGGESIPKNEKAHRTRSIPAGREYEGNNSQHLMNYW
jgi:hypothetical protein